MRSDPAPQIEVVGELSDAAIEALAQLLIDLVEAEQEGQSARC